MALESFFQPAWGTVIEQQVRLRIKLSIYAYAYEFENQSLISDHEYDKLSLQVDSSIDTGNKKLDKFFKKEFDASTGQWIHKHPELDKIKSIYKRYYTNE